MGLFSRNRVLDVAGVRFYDEKMDLDISRVDCFLALQKYYDKVIISKKHAKKAFKTLVDVLFEDNNNNIPWKVKGSLKCFSPNTNLNKNSNFHKTAGVLSVPPLEFGPQLINEDNAFFWRGKIQKDLFDFYVDDIVYESNNKLDESRSFHYKLGVSLEYEGIKRSFFFNLRKDSSGDLPGLILEKEKSKYGFNNVFKVKDTEYENFLNIIRDSRIPLSCRIEDDNRGNSHETRTSGLRLNIRRNLKDKSFCKKGTITTYCTIRNANFFLKVNYDNRESPNDSF